MTSSLPAVRFSDRLQLGEGARWCQATGTRHLVDLDDGRLFTFSADEDRLQLQLQLNTTLGAAAPVAERPGTWLLAAGDGVAIAVGDEVTWLAHLPPSAGTPVRVNDAAVDPAGRFWVSSMPICGNEQVGALHRFDPAGHLHTALTGLGVVNGPAFSPDGTFMYVTDSSARRIYRLEYDPEEGTVGARTVFAQFPPDGPSPDGMTVDGTGCLWVAMWGGSVVHQLDQTGRRRRTLPFPATQPTSVCLHPTRSGTELLVTSATAGLAAPGDGDGAVYAVRVEVLAVPMPPARLP